MLRELEQRGRRTYTTARAPLSNTAPAPLAPLAPEALARVWRQLRDRAAAEHVELPSTVRASVEERRAHVLDALRAFGEVSFRALAGRTVDEVVATFLAVLELFRRGRITVQQNGLFEDLLLRARD